MAYLKKVKKLAQKMRQRGDSIIKISKNLGVAKSTISAWTKNITLPQELRKYLTENSILGREKGLQVMKARRELDKKNIDKDALELLNTINFKNKNLSRLIAALIFWCEGSKRSLSTLGFTNSDPKLIKVFLKCIRSGFDIDEKKFRGNIHIHSYHNDQIQKEFWSKVTGIPISQFNKSYQKPNTEIRQRENYQGCISIKYNSAKVARTLDAIYHSLANLIGP